MKIRRYMPNTLSAIAILFQLALASGAPWGHLAMGGKYPGVFPPPLRIAAVVQALLIAFFALIVLTRSGTTLPAPFNSPGFVAFSSVAIWFVSLPRRRPGWRSAPSPPC